MKFRTIKLRWLIKTDLEKRHTKSKDSVSRNYEFYPILQNLLLDTITIPLKAENDSNYKRIKK